LVSVDSSEEEPKEIPYAESSNYGYVEVGEKETANIIEECFAVGFVARCDYILVKLGGRGAFHITKLK
jgi:hypothetical protein